MSDIRTLADELREAIKGGEKPPGEDPVKKAGATKPSPAKSKSKSSNVSLDSLLAELQDFELTGKEKLLIRLDDRTIFLLKQLKIARSIDMNKFIAYSLQRFLREHPELIVYIKDNIKTIEL